MTYYPIKLKSVPKNIIWGGEKLKKLYGKEAPFERIAESWELTVREDGISVIENGEFAGFTLEELIKANPSVFGTHVIPERFPLLIKFIDAARDLSIQVHPSDRYAASKGLNSGKTEIWYIVDAEPDAAIIYGAVESVSERELMTSLVGGKISDSLRKVNVKKGEVYFIPAGLIHAICEGVLVAEVQQNSNTTYRIYDYDRITEDGKKRELHINEALDVIKSYTDAEIKSAQFKGNSERRPPFNCGDVLCDCEYFRITKLSSEDTVSFTVDESAFASLLFTDADEVSVSCCGFDVKARAGESVFIPAGAGEVTVAGSFTALLSEV